MSGKVSSTTRIELRLQDQDLFRIVCFCSQPLCIVHCIMQSLASDPLCVATVLASLPSSNCRGITIVVFHFVWNIWCSYCNSWWPCLAPRSVISNMLSVEQWRQNSFQWGWWYWWSFEGDTFKLQAKEGYFQELGAWDITDPMNPSVVIPNYTQWATNCIASESFYSVCGLNECKQLMSHLEKDHQFGEGDVLTVSQAATIDEETLVRQSLPPMTMHWNSPRKPSQAASPACSRSNEFVAVMMDNEAKRTIQFRPLTWRTMRLSMLLWSEKRKVEIEEVSWSSSGDSQCPFCYQDCAL